MPRPFNFLFCFFCRRKSYRTLYTLLLQLAGELVRLFNIALINKAVCVTTARAVESCPAVGAALLAVDMGLSEKVGDFLIHLSIIYIAHFPFINTNELVAGENFPVGSYGYIFVSAAAATKPLYCTGSLL